MLFPKIWLPHEGERSKRRKITEVVEEERTEENGGRGRKK
jgi:hypothetical protein